MLVPRRPRPGSWRPALRDVPDTPTDHPKVRRLGAWTVAGDLPASFRYAARG